MFIDVVLFGMHKKPVHVCACVKVRVNVLCGGVCFPLLCLLGQPVKLAVQGTVCGLECRTPC